MSQEGFSAAQIAHYSNITLDYFIRSELWEQGIQQKPLLAKMEATKKPFAAAKEKISYPMRFDRGAGGTDDGVTGYSHDDTVDFYNPGNALRAEYIWREHHLGITMTETELKQQGILVDESFANVKRNSGDRGLVVLTDLLDAANVDVAEQYAETMNALMWDDGTTDTSALAGMRSMILDIPTLGTVGGLSAVTYDRWRNRARTAAFAGDGSFDAAHGGGAVTSAPTNGGVLLQVLQQEFRQLRRYGGKPDCFFAGSDFIDAMETEIRANGNYSDIGFTKNQDGAVGEMMFKGVKVVYDPTLDDLSRSKYAYIWDSNHIHLRNLQGDWKRVRQRNQPYNQFVLHRSLVCTGQMCCKQRDSSLVIEIT